MVAVGDHGDGMRYRGGRHDPACAATCRSWRAGRYCERKTILADASSFQKDDPAVVLSHEVSEPTTYQGTQIIELDSPPNTSPHHPSHR